VTNILPPPFDWCTVPAGKFIYSRYADRYEGKHIFYDINYDYDIGKYPITNAQFAPFIEEDCYNNRDYWTQAGWNTKEQEDWTAPLYWQDENYNQPKQPVTGISWYEAYAYTYWLSTKLDYEVHLPSEPEWEKAARSTEDRKYPWGNQWDKTKCHNSESDKGFQRYPTPVDHFPEGVSLYGAFDMAGNVKEMCMSEARTGSLKAEDPSARFNSGATHRRVVRSQSCYAGEWYAFTTYFRDSMFPKNREYNLIGFRLMRLSLKN
jgi:formylglycine-generating enzyme required for sulfatase activity